MKVEHSKVYIMKGFTLDKLKCQLITINDTTDDFADFDVLVKQKYPPKLNDFCIQWKDRIEINIPHEQGYDKEQYAHIMSFMVVKPHCKTYKMRLEDIETIFIPSSTLKLVKPDSYSINLEQHTFGVVEQNEFFSLENEGDEDCLVLVMARKSNDSQMFFKVGSVQAQTSQDSQTFESNEAIYLFRNDLKMKIRNSIYDFHKGDVIIIPHDTEHFIINDHEHDVEYMVISKKKI